MLTANDIQRIDRMIETPRLVVRWRGVCDGLSDFCESWEVRQHCKALFIGTKSAAENVLNQILSDGLSCGQFYTEGARV